MQNEEYSLRYLNLRVRLEVLFQAPQVHIHATSQYHY
jgi:hypothetical protein